MLEKEESYDGSLVSDLIHFIRNKVRLFTVLFSRCKNVLGRNKYSADMGVRHRTLIANMPLDPLIVCLELLNCTAQ